MSNRTKIEFSSLVSTDVKLTIYNINGQRVWSKTHKALAGDNSILWSGKSINGTILASGVYFISLDDGQKKIQEKITLIR